MLTENTKALVADILGSKAEYNLFVKDSDRKTPEVNVWHIYKFDWINIKSWTICTNGIVQNTIRISPETNLPLRWAAV